MSKCTLSSYSRVDVEEGGKLNSAFEIESPEGKKAIDEDQEARDREKWDTPFEFLLTCIALSVGLGNIWRFPYIAYKYGGGAFLIPYLVVITLIGRPMYFFELSLGQFSSMGQIKVWKISPMFKGVGYMSMCGNVCVMSFYAVIMAITFSYFFSSFQVDLPWGFCDDKWVGLGYGAQIFNDTTGQVIREQLVCNENDTSFAFEGIHGNRSSVSLAQLYFQNEVIKAKFQIDDGLGAPDWKLTCLLFLAWFIIWAILVRGVKATGKAAYFTALFPYVVMIIMLIRGLTLPNAWKGIKYFIVPDWKRMLEIDVWFQAVQQCFFSLTLGFGVLQMFGSYNPFRHNVNRDAWIVSGMDTFTSLLAGFTIFSVLGNLAGELDVDIAHVALAGPGLTFISFAQGLTTFPAAPFFAVMFYLMLLTLGIGSGVAMGGALVTIILDQWPNFPRWMATTAVCGVMFLSGLVYVTPGGFFILDIVDHFGANFVIYVIAIIETSAVSYVYGINRFLGDIKFMLGFPVGLYWKFTWAFCIPVGMTGILAYSISQEKRLDYPDSAIAAAWTLAAMILLVFPICAAHAIYTRKVSGFMEKFKEALRPAKEWGPQNPALRKLWDESNRLLDY